eukprot:2032663-Pyramimonas_sp.AAC.1
MVHGLRWAADMNWDEEGNALLQWLRRLPMGCLTQRMTQGCRLLVIAFIKPPGCGWGSIDT